MRKLIPSFFIRDIIFCSLSAALYLTAGILYLCQNPGLGADFILSAIIVLDAAILHFLIKQAERHIVMIIFTASYNVLLLSRVFTKWIIDHQNLCTAIEADSVYSMFETFSILFLGLAFVFAAYRVTGILLKDREASIDSGYIYEHKTDGLLETIRILSLISFFCFFAFSLYWSVKTAQLVSNVGYLESFKESADIPYFLRTLASLAVPAFTLFLATRPSKKAIIVPLCFYVVLILASLLSGRRNLFTRDVLMLLIYFVMRDDFRKSAQKLFTKARVVISAGAGIVCMYLLQGVRSGFRASFLRTIFNFIYDQGASIRVVAKTVTYSGIFSDNPLRYFLYPLEIQLRNGYIGGFLGMTSIIEQQTAAFAVSTYNYAHKLTYFVDPERYLSGGGFGASYICDGYILGKAAGVILLSVILGCIIRIFPSLFTRNVFFTAFGLIVIRYVVYMPRSFFLGFVTDAFSPAVICLYSGVLLAAYIINRILKRRAHAVKTEE